MTAPVERFDRDLVDWLELEGAVRAPIWLHGAAMATIVHSRQRPGWLVLLRSALAGSAPLGRTRYQTMFRTAIVIGLLLVGLVVAWLVVGRPAPANPVQNGQILIGRQLDAPSVEYLTMRPDGSAVLRLFEKEQCDQCAWWSPDGKRIMFPESVDGRLLTAIVRADGASKVVLQPLPDTTVNLGPGGWSADGSLIALTGWDETDPSLRGVYVATPEGTDLHQVSHSDDGRGHDWIAFSPDGSRILYQAIDEGEPPGGGIAGDLFVVNTDGTGQRQVNPPGTKVIATVRVGRPMDWSPDGRTIVFAATEGSLAGDRSAIFVANADGSSARRVSDWASGVRSVDWAPAGSWVLSGDTDDGLESMWLLDPGTTERRQLWTSTALDAACCGTWSPDGALILFERGPGGRRDLWTMRPNGSIVDQVTHVPADYVWYSWARATADDSSGP